MDAIPLCFQKSTKRKQMTNYPWICICNFFMILVPANFGQTGHHVCAYRFFVGVHTWTMCRWILIKFHKKANNSIVYMLFEKTSVCCKHMQVSKNTIKCNTLPEKVAISWLHTYTHAITTRQTRTVTTVLETTRLQSSPCVLYFMVDASSLRRYTYSIGMLLCENGPAERSFERKACSPWPCT